MQIVKDHNVKALWTIYPHLRHVSTFSHQMQRWRRLHSICWKFCQEPWPLFAYLFAPFCSSSSSSVSILPAPATSGCTSPTVCTSSRKGSMVVQTQLLEKCVHSRDKLLQWMSMQKSFHFMLSSTSSFPFTEEGAKRREWKSVFNSVVFSPQVLACTADVFYWTASSSAWMHLGGLGKKSFNWNDIQSELKRLK